MANTGFQITNTGLTAAAGAAPGGPYIHISRFRVGAGFNYTPDPTGTETNLHGSILYTSTPQSFSVIDSNTFDIVLQMDPTVGPFAFGEVAVDIDDGLGGFVMFASMAFDTLQTKDKAAGNQAGSIWRIHARLVLQQLPNICTVNVINALTLLEVANWSALVPPASQPSGANAAIVHEANFGAESVLVVRDTNTNWAILDYVKLLAASIADLGASATTSSITHPSISSLSMPSPSGARYLAKFSDGNIRNITSIVTTTINWAPVLGGVPSGAFSIWEDEASHQAQEATARTTTDASLQAQITAEVNTRTANDVTATIGVLTANAVMVGAGGKDSKPLSSLGSSGQVLTSNGPGTPPSMQNLPPASTPPITAMTNIGGGGGQSFSNVVGGQAQMRSIATGLSITGGVSSGSFTATTGPDTIALNLSLNIPAIAGPPGPPGPAGTPSGGGDCFLPTALVVMADYTHKEISQIKVGDLIWDSKQKTPVMGLRSVILGDRQAWRLNGEVTTGDHLFILEDGCSWGAIDPTLYSDLRENKGTFITGGDGVGQQAFVTIDGRKVTKIVNGTVLLGGKIAEVEAVTYPWETMLHSIKTKSGMFLLANNLLADGMPE